MTPSRINLFRKPWIAAAVTGVAACGIYHGAKQHTVGHRASAQVIATPFVAEMHSYSYKSNPTGELLAKRMLARRSDGTTVSIHSAGPVEKGWTSRKVQYMDGRYTGIVDRISSVIRGSSGTSQLAGLKSRLLNPPVNCSVDVSFQFKGYEQVFGRRLAKVVRDSPASVFTAWHDPQFGCEILQSYLEDKLPDGSLKTVSRLMLVGLRVGEPDQRLFEEPSAYQKLTGVKDLESRFEEAVKGELTAVPGGR